ncbi:MAG: ABC transporter permease [Maricaulaceae bacterium]
MVTQSKFARYRELIPQMIKRDINERYRGSLLGIFWSFITPLILLGVYTFVFGTVMEARWSSGSEASTAEFAIILFAGLTVFQIFADMLTRAPILIIANTNYVKKVVFPLEVLVPVALGSALFHGFISFIILFFFVYQVFGNIPITALWLPVILVPFCTLMLGLGWFLAALGVYLRDIGQFIGTFITAMMFLAPIFYPPSLLPEWIAPYIVYNPIVVPINQTRDVAIFGEMPDWSQLGLYTLISMAVCCLGFAFFQKTRKGFADVL